MNHLQVMIRHLMMMYQLQHVQKKYNNNNDSDSDSDHFYQKPKNDNNALQQFIAIYGWHKVYNTSLQLNRSLELKLKN